MRLSPREQGDLGEYSAIEWLGSHGFHVYVPVGHSPDVDLIALYDEDALKVQVKTSTQFRNGRWAVMLSTQGGNQSWNGVVKFFHSSRCDRVFVLVGDGRRWFIPTTEIAATTKLTLGGPKYADFEVEPGRPLPISTVP
jgi:PD-(D/E)XK endonuclease